MEDRRRIGYNVNPKVYSLLCEAALVPSEPNSNFPYIIVFDVPSTVLNVEEILNVEVYNPGQSTGYKPLLKLEKRNMDAFIMTIPKNIYDTINSISDRRIGITTRDLFLESNAIIEYKMIFRSVV